MDFTNRNLALLFEIGGTPVYLTDTLVATWVVMAVLIAFTVVVRVKMRKFTDIPATGFQHFIEVCVEQIDNLGTMMMDASLSNFNGFFFGLFAFILLSNYIGLLGLRPPTADISTTFALALTIFILIHAMGIRRLKGGYLKSFIEPNAIFLPINLIGEISKPISLGFRLFGNILGGLIILGLIYELLPLLLRFVLPSALHLYFDVLVGALQAFIFTVLSMTYLKQKAIREE